MQSDHSEEAFLPAFCTPMAVFLVVLVGELVAVFIALVLSRLPDFNWQALGAVSLFVQWLGLSAAAVLCALRPWLIRYVLAQQVLATFLVIVLLAGFYSWLGGVFLPSGHEGFWSITRDMMLSALVAGLGLRYFVLQYLHRRQKQSELTSRVEALQARIAPHFMFNTLNAIASVIHVDQDKAEAMTLDFADLMRAAMQQPALVPLSTELVLCRQYVALEQNRFGERLAVLWQIDAAAEALRVPNLLLQPLIENAIYHGIQGRAGGGTIKVTASADQQNVCLRIWNPAADSDFESTNGHGLALDNIRHRLALLYSGRASLTSHASDDDFAVTLMLPINVASVDAVS